MEIKSYAKINLCLKVFKDKRNEKKHQIDSIFYLYKNLFDEIYISPSNSQSIKYIIDGKEQTIPDCLISKTLKYLKEKFDWNTNYTILIGKQIPIGSGLGGASSNAAAIINYLLSVNSHQALDLKDIALNLGSDIPFFLSEYQIARVKRYGEYVAPLMQIKTKFELIPTNIQCSTKEVFDLLEKDPTYESKVDVDNIFKNIINKQHLNVVYNDLTEYIIKSNNQLQQIAKANPQAWFSGSGGMLVKIKEN